MASGVTIQALKRLTHLQDNVENFEAHLIAGQEYYDVYFTGGYIRADTLILPVGTTAQRPVPPVDGMIRVNTTIPAVEAYYNGMWNPLTGGSVIPTNALLDQSGVAMEDQSGTILEGQN